MNIASASQSDSSQSPNERGFFQIAGSALGELYNHRKRTIASLAISTSLGIIIAFALPKEYRSSSTYLLTTPTKTADLSSLAGSLDGGSLSSIFSGGYGNRSSVRELMSILETRELALAAIDTFRLDSLWKKKRNVWENLQRRWTSEFDFMENENGAIEISFKGTDSALTKKVVLWVGAYAEKRFQRLKQVQQETELTFVRERTKERKELFESAEDSLLEFQKTNKMFAPDEQLHFLATSLMEKEKSLEEIDQRIKVSTLESGQESQSVRYLSTLRQQLDKSIGRMLDSGKSNTNLTKSIPLSLQKALTYNRLHRNAMIQGKIYGYLLQQQEQISIEKQKSFPALQMIDGPRTPTKKVAPPRIAIIAFFAFLGFVANAGHLFFRTDLQVFWQAFVKQIRNPV